MRIERELMRGAGPFAVLKLLERREMYGYELIDAISKRSGGILAMGQSTLYPLLYNLEAKGLIESTERTAPSGRERRYYHLTRKGHAQLVTEARPSEALGRASRALGILPGPASEQGVLA